jgi:hypothetical protein
MMRVRVAAAVIVLLVTGCSGAGIRPPWLSTGIPLEGEPEIGVTYQVAVNSHCGLRAVEFDGSRWAISGELDDGSMNPPPGFGNPVDHGTITLTGPETAIYHSEFGERRELTRGGGLPPVAGCL